MHIAVSIVGYRNADDIVRCLAALDSSTYPDFEVVICENGGPGAYAALVQRIPAVLTDGQPVKAICAPRNLGYAGGVNCCLAAASGADAWWVLNPDTEPEADAITHLAARLGKGDCDAVGGTVYLPGGMVQSYGGQWHSRFARAVSIGYGLRLSANDSPDGAEIEQKQNYLNGASMLIGRGFLELAGFMREDYFLYCEEVEWCLRAISRGARLGFAAEARVLHHQGTTMGDFADLRRRGPLSIHLSERNKIQLTRDCFPGMTLVVIAVSLPLLLYRYGRRRAWRQCLYGVRGWWAGVLGERGAPPWMAT